MIDNPMEILFAIILVASGLIAAWFLIGILARWRCDRRLQASVTSQGILALTYDDGPGSQTTPELLDLLDEHGTKATFFLIGDSAERHPDIVSRLIDEGHTIGWHTQTHRNQWMTDPIRGINDLRISSHQHAIDGDSIKVFRPPFGKLTLGTVATCLMRGWRIITWTHPSGDTYQDLPNIDAFVNSIDEAGGGVVLMHDMDRDEPSRARFVLGVTSALIDLARKRHWRIIHSVEDWNQIT